MEKWINFRFNGSRISIYRFPSDKTFKCTKQASVQTRRLTLGFKGWMFSYFLGKKKQTASVLLSFPKRESIDLAVSINPLFL